MSAAPRAKDPHAPNQTRWEMSSDASIEQSKHLTLGNVVPLSDETVNEEMARTAQGSKPRALFTRVDESWAANSDDPPPRATARCH